MSVEAVRAYLTDVFPQVFEDHGVVVETAAAGFARLRLLPDARHLRPGGIVSGPTLMMLADAAAYAALLSGTSAAKMAVTSNLNITFMRAGAANDAVLQEARVIKWGKRLCVIVAEALTPEGTVVAHTTMTYAMPAET